MAVREQEFKPQVGSLEQLINNIKGDGLAGLIETINPNIANRPDYQNLKSFGKGTADFVMDPLNLIGGTGAAIKGATILSDIPVVLYNKFNEVTKKLENVRLAIKRENKNSITEDNARALARLKKEESKLTAQQKTFNNDIALETGHDLLGLEAARKAKKAGILSLIKDPSSLFHGSQTTGIKSLKLPKGYGSEGGVYLADRLNDPRVKMFTEGLRSKGKPGSTYVARPDFNKVLDLENTNKQVNRTLKNLQKDLDRKAKVRNPLLNSEAGYQVSQIRRGTAAPTFFDKRVGEGILDLGFDAIRFPTAKKLKGAGFKDYGDTIISLDPENTLDVLEEIPYDQLAEYIRLLSK